MNIKKIQNEKIYNDYIDYTNLIFDEVIVIDTNKINKLNQCKDINFSNTIFNKEVIFDNCEFKKSIIFINTQFNNNVSFNNCIFNGDCIFKNVDFNKNTTSKKIFIKSKLKGQKLVFESIKNMPRLDGIVFSHCCKVSMKNVYYSKADYKHAKVNYRIAKNQSSIIGDYEKVGHYYYMERYYGGKCIKRNDFNTNMEYINSKFIDILSKYIIGYGEKPLNIFIISFFIVSIFALLYMFTGIKNVNNEIIKDYLDLWYFSMSTFSTVGYGDMVVNSTFGKLLVSIEVFLGVTMGASWASVLFRKMSR